MGADSEQGKKLAEIVETAYETWGARHGMSIHGAIALGAQLGFQAGVESNKERETKLIRLLDKCSLDLHGWQQACPDPRFIAASEFQLVQDCFDIVQEFDAASLSLQGRKQEK